MLPTLYSLKLIPIFIHSYQIMLLQELRNSLRQYRTLDIIFCLLIAVISLAYSYISGFTAYQYNDIDMLPFLERKADAEFITVDFFTNASAAPNSRHLWGYLILGLSKITGLEWYTVLYALKVLFVTVAGALYYNVLTMFYAILVNRNHRTFRLIIFGFITLCVSNIYFVQFFTIAWWPPFQQDINAHNISICFGLLSIILTGHFTAYISLFVASLLHPVFGVFFLAIHGMLALYFRQYRLITLHVLAVVIPFILHALLFKPTVALGAKEFVFIYARYFHAPHYIPTEFGRMGLSSLQAYLFMTVLLVGASTYFHILKKPKLRNLSVLVVLAMNLLILTQYILVEKFPVKIVAIIGPSRYLLFVGWCIALIYGILISGLIEQYNMLSLIRKKASELLNSKIPVLILSVMVVLEIVLLMATIDHPAQQYNKPVLQWIRSNTPENSTFSVPPGMLDEMNVRYIAKRAVFAGKCFPFREDFFQEQYQRFILLYGTGINDNAKTEQEKKLKFYRNLNGKSFQKIASVFPLDYVILLTEDTIRFPELKPEYCDAEFAIYKVSKM